MTDPIDPLRGVILSLDNIDIVADRLRTVLRGKVFVAVQTKEGVDGFGYVTPNLRLSVDPNYGVVVQKDELYEAALLSITTQTYEWRFGVKRQGHLDLKAVKHILFRPDYIQFRRQTSSGSSEGAIYETVVQEHILLIIQKDQDPESQAP